MPEKINFDDIIVNINLFKKLTDKEKINYINYIKHLML